MGENRLPLAISMPPLSIIFGKKSDNEPFEKTLETLPHVLVSFAERSQWQRLSQLILSQLLTKTQGTDLRLFIALRDSTPLPDHQQSTWLYNPIDTSLFMSKQLFAQQFLEAVAVAEKRDLQKIRKGQLPDTTIPVSVMLMLDDLVDFLLQIRKTTAQKILKLLYTQQGMGVCMIFSSTHGRYHLVRQLQPWNKRSMELPPLAELVLSSDDLYFFRMTNDPQFQRFYDVDEGAREG